MQYSYDINDKLVQPKLILANPQKRKIGLISGAIDLEVNLYFNSISELTFKIYQYSDGIKNEYYDKIVPMRLIEARYMMWFQIRKVETKQDENSKAIYKEVTCLSLENELIYKKIYDISGTFALFSVTDTEYSLLHIIAQSCSWGVGHVDASLIDLWRTFDIDSESIYNLLTGSISKSFNCIFQFNTYDRTLNAYELANIGDMTNIIISDKNVLNTYVKEEDLDKIVTKMRVRGSTNTDGSEFSIREVNFGMNYIINVSYYMNTDWMSQSLITALQNYNIKKNNYQTQYTNLLSTWKTYQSELTTLKTQLVDLQSQYDAENIVCGTYVSLLGRVPIPSDAEYTQYQNSLTAMNTLFNQMSSKKAEITNKESQISSTVNSLDNIGIDLSLSTNFTQEQLDELDMFLKEGDDYIDETFATTDLTTKEEAIEMKLQLLQNATEELARKSRPQYTISTSISNILTIQDESDSKVSYKSHRDKFVTGNLITLKFRDNFMVGVRLMSMKMFFKDRANLEVTFSDKSRLDDDLIQLAEILAQADRTSIAVSYEKIGWKNASDYTNEFKLFKDGMLNLATNAIKTNDNQKPLIDNYGIHMMKWLPDQNIYSPYQAWFTNNQLLFTNDSWKSSIGGIGVFDWCKINGSIR